MVKKYTKRPLVVEAICFDGSEESAMKIIDWANGENISWSRESDEESNPKYRDIVLTVINGDNFLTVKQSDWIVRGYFGEFYPCQDKIFKATYLEVEE